MENKYDIFISYRTDDTSERAEYLYKLLHQYNRKWNISYARKNLNGEWHIELIRRIDSSKNVIVLIGDETFNYNEKNLNDDVELYGYLSTASLDQIKQKIEEMQTQNRQPDYLRLEIARALKKADTMRIVPLILYKNKIFDLQDLLLPKDIAGLKNCQSVSYHNHKKNSMLFDSIIESVVEKLKKEDDMVALCFKRLCMVMVVFFIIIAICKYSMEFIKEEGIVVQSDTIVSYIKEDTLLKLDTFDSHIEKEDTFWDLDLGYGQWHGGTKDGKPHGNGSLDLYQSHNFYGVQAQAGYRLEGQFNNGILVIGKLYDCDNNIIRTIMP